MGQLGGVGASLGEGGVPGRSYGPRLPGTSSSGGAPANRLGPQLLLVPVPVSAGQQPSPLLLAGANPQRYTLSIAWVSGPRVWIGDDPSMQPGPNPGANSFPLEPGQTVHFDPDEYVGPLYAIADAPVNAWGAVAGPPSPVVSVLESSQGVIV